VVSCAVQGSAGVKGVGGGKLVSGEALDVVVFEVAGQLYGLPASDVRELVRAVAIAAVLARRTGLSFTPPRQPGAEQGIRRAMHRAGVADLEAYGKWIETEEAALDDLIVELTVGETYFFREPDQFAFLRREVVPTYRARVTERMARWGLRAWSAGCASGEEAYSLAMLFDSEGLAAHVSVLGTDISHAALARARKGVYRSWSLRGDGAPQARPYLARQEGGWTVVEAVRRLVTFAHLNLALDVYPSLATGTWGMDLIFCRNVLIYFDADTVAAVARRLFASLAPGGWLFLASSDPPLNQIGPFEIVVAPEGVFYRRAALGHTATQPRHPPALFPHPPGPLSQGGRGGDGEEPLIGAPSPLRGGGSRESRSDSSLARRACHSPLSRLGKGAGGEG
jgi:chemotaxis protein methyltransferase CheR